MPLPQTSALIGQSSTDLTFVDLMPIHRAPKWL